MKSNLILVLLSTCLMLQANADSQGLCLGCTVVTAVIEQLTQVHNDTVDQAMSRFCDCLPLALQPECRLLIATFGPAVIVAIDNRETPDRVCQILRMCKDDSCRLFPPPQFAASVSVAQRRRQWAHLVHSGQDAALKSMRDAIEKAERRMGETWTPWGWLFSIINRMAKYHKPLVDLDGDMFGPADWFELRGSAWRGADCDDGNARIYPGAGTIDGDATIDANCNGIVGVDPASGKTYEELWCSAVPNYGFAILGDSVGAHFHLPPEWVMAQKITPDTFSKAVEILSNEIDWPYMSSGTGYAQKENPEMHELLAWAGTPQGDVRSQYLSMRERNLCMHRDFQNLAVNGARSGAMADNIVHSLQRNATTDPPMIVTVALIGDDICTPHNSFDSETKPAEFKKNVQSILATLDNTLPPKSHVFIIGVINGSIIWDTLANEIHPIGALHQDVTYATFWQWLICLEANPCWGWLVDNSTIRHMSSVRAAELNDQSKDIVATQKFKNFDLRYWDDPTDEVVSRWVKGGGKVTDLFEKIIGMHPSQPAQALASEVLEDIFKKEAPDLLGPVNPNNAKIASKFGKWLNGYFK